MPPNHWMITMIYVSLKQLAAELDLDRSTLRKYVHKRGFTMLRVRTPDSRAQQTLALSLEDAEQVKELRQEQGYGAAGMPAANGRGYFYVVQLVPELDPRRLKFGFAGDVDARLSAHRTAAPTACLLKSWPCRKHWEFTAIDAITRSGCRMIGSEVYEADDLEDVIERAEAFFALLPPA